MLGHYGSERIANTAISAITSDIVELQSLDVDAVTGATLTSMAIPLRSETASGKLAARFRFGEGPGREKSDAVEVIETEVAIIGAGAAGLTSAIALAGESGTGVLVMEKCGFIGGNMLVSGGRLQYPRRRLSIAREQQADGAAFAEVMERARDLGVSEERVSQVEQQYEQWYAEETPRPSTATRFYAVLGAVGFSNLSRCGTTLDAESARRACGWVTAHGVELEPLLGIMGFSWPRSTHPVGRPAGRRLR